MLEPFPVIDRDAVDGDRANSHLWPFLSELAEELPGTWVLVGGQMVLLHALEHNQLPERETADADVLVDVRALQRGTQRLANALRQRGLDLEGITPDGVGHRFTGAGFIVDVLAPDNLGDRVDLTTVPPAHTVQTPAGTRLVRAPRRCPITVAGEIYYVPRPDLDAAIIGKAAALGIAGDRRRHCEDIAFLCGLVQDPSTVSAALSRSDRKHLEQARSLLDDDRVWSYATDRAAARAVLRYLLR